MLIVVKLFRLITFFLFPQALWRSSRERIDAPCLLFNLNQPPAIQTKPVNAPVRLLSDAGYLWLY